MRLSVRVCCFVGVIVTGELGKEGEWESGRGQALQRMGTGPDAGPGGAWHGVGGWGLAELGLGDPGGRRDGPRRRLTYRRLETGI